MATELTDQQRIAVEVRQTSVVLASGAGCGKTHVLTERYLSHLTIDNATVAQVVAITFTDRAAREMRDRIRIAIEKLPDSTHHLRALETAPIATIHAFCGNVLRQFAIPAGLDPGFEVLDDVLSANLRTEAITRCLRNLLSAEEPYAPATSALRELIVLFGYPAVLEAVDALLLEADRPAWQAWLDRSPAEIASEWTGQRRTELLPEWIAYLCAASPKIARCLTLLEQIQSSNPRVMTKVSRLLAEVPRLHEAADLATTIKELTELAKVVGVGKKEWPDETTYERVKKAFEDFRGDLPKRFETFTADTHGAEDAARIGQLFLRVALAADDHYRQRKRRAGVLDFQDLLTLTRDLIKERPEVRETLRQRFRFLLLDELQDTDPVQMELVDLLCGPGMARDKLFAVGDHKQSIYRFRGAEVGLFRALRASVASAGRLELTRNFRSQPGILHFVNALFSKRIPDYEPLIPHHPSATAAANVEFLWATSERGTRNAELSSAERGTRNAEPKTDTKNAERGTENQNEERGSDASSLRAPRSEFRTGEFRTSEADAIARRIAALLDDPTPRVLDRGGVPRRVERKDVVLLLRSMTHAAVYESALRRHGLDYYLVGGRAFFAQQEVYDLLNLLRAVENPQDTASLVGALRSPFFNVSDEAVFLLAAHPEGLWAGLNNTERVATLPSEQRPAAERAARWLANWRAIKDRLPIARLLNAILADSGYDAALQFEFLGDRKLANLWKLIEMARSFDRTGLFGLHEFTARLGDLVTRQPREEQAATLPESADVVKLMSIHQAKGLEFPVVFVPDFAAQGRGNHYAVARWDRRLGCLVRLPTEFEELAEGEERPFAGFAHDLGKTADQLADWQEDLRVLYVACTRARDLLVLSAGLPGPLAPTDHLPANHWTLTLEERFDVRTGQCLVSGLSPGDVPFAPVTFAEPAADEPDVASRAVSSPRSLRGAPPPPPVRSRPSVVSLSVLEALARGETVAHAREHFDVEDDSDRSSWRTPRERVGPVTVADGILGTVLERWNFADVDGWVELLADALEDGADRKVGDALQPQLRGFAESTVRTTLAAAEEVERSIEFQVDLATISNLPTPLTIRGVIDLLYRDATGWHVLGIDRGTALEDDPWRGRRAGLVLQAWAISRQLGVWPVSIALFDLVTGQLVRADPRRFPLPAVAEHFVRAANQQPLGGG